MRPLYPGILAVTNFRPETMPRQDLARDELLALADVEGIGAEVRELLKNRPPPPTWTFKRIVAVSIKMRQTSINGFARQKGIPPTMLNAYMAGTIVPKAEAILRLGQALDLHWIIVVIALLRQHDWLICAPGAQIPRMRYRHRISRYARVELARPDSAITNREMPKPDGPSLQLSDRK